MGGADFVGEPVKALGCIEIHPKAADLLEFTSPLGERSARSDG
jgi:hypothetical protein